MGNYSATVVRINNIRPHSNADRLSVTEIFGNNVIVGKETKVGDIGLFFPLEAQIGLEFAQANDLIRRKDAEGKPAGGMFAENRRVRAVTLRGEKSMGFFIPIDSILTFLKHVGSSVTSIDGYNEGYELEKIGDFIISQKYVIQSSGTVNKALKKNRQAPRESRVVPGQFNFHGDTAQLGKNIHKISPEDLIVITWKMHGTSAIVSRILTKRKLGLLERILLKFNVLIDSLSYDYVYASRRVIKNEFEEAKQHYYDTDIWTTVGKEHFEGKLHTGETIYYEIVGYTPSGTPIQKGFDYGCSIDGLIKKCDPDCVHGTVTLEVVPKYKVYVYRITQTANDGTVTELQWNQVKQRAKELGVETVPVIYYGPAGKSVPILIDTDGGVRLYCNNIIADESSWRENFLRTLKEVYVYDQDSQFCTNKVPEEGIVVRKEGLQIEAYKLKSFRFLEFETKSLDKGETNIEDNSVDDGDEDIKI